MRTLVHLSDLHFGRVDVALIDPLIQLVMQLKPDVVVVSGDLTQRARSEEFKQARQFLDALPSPKIIVPGNHDVPLYNIFNRFARPLDQYRRYITNDLQPFFADDEIAILGINSARSLTFKNGRINERQIADIQARLSTLDSHTVKVIVTHHPFDLPADYAKKKVVGRAPMAMKIFARHSADLLLAGHLHVSHAGSTAARYALKGYAALVVQAGTATSTRNRGESNSFNVIEINSPHISIKRFTWVPERGAFTVSGKELFQRGANGWSRDSATKE
jgi:3',5'-cyclic AMP phosphodiesterase CpdA